ncbi:hypothetical protein [Marinomonas fungiae]|uniref:hypothetical protein n=1 Tax=Marinomonas fungiae TaxID=1137284 RepID=UPI003A8D9157
MLDPKGQIGVQEKELIITATILMLLVVVPVIFMTFTSRGNIVKAVEAYEPKWSHSTKIEAVVWIIQYHYRDSWCNYLQSTHALNPYKPIESEEEAITVEVVSLNWNGCSFTQILVSRR